MDETEPQPGCIDFADRSSKSRVNFFVSLHARHVLREKGTPAAELGLLDPSVSDDHHLDAMIAHPILVNPPGTPAPTASYLHP